MNQMMNQFKCYKQDQNISQIGNNQLNQLNQINQLNQQTTVKVGITARRLKAKAKTTGKRRSEINERGK